MHTWLKTKAVDIVKSNIFLYYPFTLFVIIYMWISDVLRQHKDLTNIHHFLTIIIWQVGIIVLQDSIIIEEVVIGLWPVDIVQKWTFFTLIFFHLVPNFHTEFLVRPIFLFLLCMFFFIPVNSGLALRYLLLNWSSRSKILKNRRLKN